MKYSIDDWVIYRAFEDCDPAGMLYQLTEKAVILDVLSDDPYYDYKIYIDSDNPRVKKVREKNLESLPKGAKND